MQKANHCKRWDGKRNFHSRYAYENNKQHKQFTKGSLVRTLPSYDKCPGAVLSSCLREEKNWAADAIEELAGRQLKAEAAQTSGCSEKK